MKIIKKSIRIVSVVLVLILAVLPAQRTYAMHEGYCPVCEKEERERKTPKQQVGVWVEIMDPERKKASRDLLKAVYARDVHAARVALEHHADIEVRDGGGQSPLQCAARHGYSEIVALLLANDASIDAQAKDGKSALILSAIYGYPDIAELLLKSNADVNQPLACTEWHRTPLMMAIICGYPQTEQLLLDYKADPEIVDGCGSKARVYRIMTRSRQSKKEQNGHVAHEALRMKNSPVLFGQKVTVQKTKKQMSGSQRVVSDANGLSRYVSQQYSTLSRRLRRNSRTHRANRQAMAELTPSQLFDLEYVAADRGVSPEDYVAEYLADVHAHATKRSAAAVSEDSKESSE